MGQGGEAESLDGMRLDPKLVLKSGLETGYSHRGSKAITKTAGVDQGAC